MVMEVVHEDAGEDDGMHCSDHPHKNSTPGGICAFCLQEKLGKLVSSSYPSSVFPSSSSSISPSPSSRSAFNGAAATTSAAAGAGPHPSARKSRLSPFVSAHSYKKKEKQSATATATGGSDSAAAVTVFKRSKSIATPRRGNPNTNSNSNSNMNRFLDESYGNYSPNRRGFWSFLYSSKHSTPKRSDGQLKDLSFTTPTHSTASTAVGSSSVRTNRDVDVDDDDDDEFVVVDENGIGMSPKVSRSRSVGCGSRSFSGDFFDRISTGFGDCTLRRVESQREGGTASANSKLKVQPIRRNVKNSGQDFMKSRVRCGGIFSSFMVASVEESNIKSKSWVWAFASPMRAFGKPSSGRRGAAISNNKNHNSSSSKNESPNLGAIPSLLAASG